MMDLYLKGRKKFETGNILEMIKNIDEKSSYVYEMVNLKPEKTGQPFELLVDELGKNRSKYQNLPKFKLKANNVELDVIITPDFRAEIINSDKQKIQKFKYYKEAIEFIEKYHKSLIMHWNGEIDFYDLLSIIMLTNKTNCTIDNSIKQVLGNL